MEKALLHRSFVLQEVIESEREYVRRLQMATEYYLEPIRSGGDKLPVGLKSDVLSIFSTLPDIYTFHRDVFLPALEVCKDNPEALMKCFIDHESAFEVYLPYCKNKLVSDAVRSVYDAYFQERQASLGQKLSIEDLLIAPIHRFTKYQLLIKDLLKDTMKAQLDTTNIERALELMKRIPKETNNIICMSLLRGISRASIIGHGSLWRQESLQFWDPQKGVKGDPRHVFLFDHKILIALPVNTEGFFDFQMGIKTLHGHLVESVEGEPLRFGFRDSEGCQYEFQVGNGQAKAQWLSDLSSILSSQERMRKALLFGKKLSPKTKVRVHSATLAWSGSDSSIDSMPDSSSSEGEADWPEHTGYQAVKSSQHRVPSLIVTPVMGRGRSNTITLPEATFSFNESDLSKQRLSLNLTPKLLSRWFGRHNSTVQERSMVYFPLATTVNVTETEMLVRSPGAIPKFRQKSTLPSPAAEVAYMSKKDQPAIAKQLYTPLPGQVFVPVDKSLGEVWKVRVLSGGNSSEEVFIQASCVEEFTAPVFSDSLSQIYHIKKTIGRGRFSKLKLGKHRVTGVSHALKVLRGGDAVARDFQRELCIGYRLTHRNLVQFCGGVEGKELVLIMEHLTGRLLFDYLCHKSSVSETAVCSLMSQLLEALHYLHSHLIVHLDIRPDNILIQVCRDGDTLKLLDFGAARLVGKGPPLHSYETTSNYEYTAPEAFQQNTRVPTTDIWGVGIIVYAIFYGCTPFKGNSSVRTIANVTSLGYTFPSEHACSQQVRALLRDIFVERPSDRPTAHAALEYSWFKDSSSFSHTLVDLVRLRKLL